MPRRYYYKDSSSDEDEPPKKKSSSGICNTIQFEEGEIVTDILGKNWKLGSTIGVGGFGVIYEASENTARELKADYSYVAKVEKHTSGPLFVEINCYLRIGKLEMIEQWKKQNKLKFLGMPHYVASGSCYHNNEKYRFLLIPKYKKDLGQILKEKKVFNIKTVSNICIQILDILEYIHSKGYVHCDIKASNIMLGNESRLKLPNQNVQFEESHKIFDRKLRVCKNPKHSRKSKRNLRPINIVNYVDDIPYLDEVLDMHENAKTLKESQHHRDSAYSSSEINKVETKILDQVYLVDFGLASKFLQSNGEYKEFSGDERRAHAGTILFCSRDAHKGVPSSRSDLESLAYNMVYWLTGTLPWIEDLEQTTEVEKKKIRCFKNLKSFLDFCFNNDAPRFVMDYFEYLNKLQYMETPDYNYCRSIFKKAIKVYAYKQDSALDFDNKEGWGDKQKKIKSNKKIITHSSFLKTSPLMPLNSNIVFKRPKLRKQLKDVKIQTSIMNWSKILIDPETILKQARERKMTEGSDSSNLSSLDIDSMNPTPEMLNIYNKCMEREASPVHKTDSPTTENIEGYTPAMMSIYNKIQERKEIFYGMMVNGFKEPNNNNTRNFRRRVKRSASPMEKVSKIKPQLNGRKKVPFSDVVAKKAKSLSHRRNYRLRG
ncbi:serine/threonine-protein kinase VRK1-like [Diorhabda sublineata]|uniref:serine/threonine-protein kinase VRK1-like n=1 Tax=Diorhabda sublineata TaxID=1163346 RepID=UPI0024E0CF8E|nr:serine/threonine-protein kinase VRK1-like [Diorhabda sublineata]